MYRHPLFIDATVEPFSEVRTCYGASDEPTCRQILYALNRRLPRGFPSGSARPVSIEPGPQTALGGRTFNVTFHS